MIVRSYDSFIKLVGEQDLLAKIQESEFSKNYIVDFGIADSRSVVDLTLKLEFKKELPDIELKGSAGRIIYNADTSVEDIITLIDYFFDIVRQTKSQFIIHGSAISKNQKGIILFGTVSGLGKTTVAIKLCEQHGFSFISDEKILVENGKIVSGISRLKFNKQELNYSIGSKYNGIDLSKTLDIQLTKLPIRLSCMIVPVLSNSSTEIQVWDESKADFHIYEELSRKARGISRRINNFTFPIKSLDTQVYALKRSDTAKHISKIAKCALIKGSAKAVADFIDSAL